MGPINIFKPYLLLRHCDHVLSRRGLEVWGVVGRRAVVVALLGCLLCRKGSQLTHVHVDRLRNNYRFVKKQLLESLVLDSHCSQ